MGIERRLRGSIGALVLANGSHLPSGRFRIEQTNSGRTFLYCERNVPVVFTGLRGGFTHFQGQTAAGQIIRTHGGLRNCIDGPKEVCFALRNVEVGQVGTDGHAHSLSLTNLSFPTDNPDPIDFTVSWAGTVLSVRVSPRRNYLERVRQLAKTEAVVPTAILSFRAPDLAGDATGDFINDLCLALSVVQGKNLRVPSSSTLGSLRFRNLHGQP